MSDVTAGAGRAGVSVRVAGEADLDAVTGLFLGYLEFYEVPVEDPERPRAYLAERMAKGESTVLVAERDGVGIVGFAQVYPTFASLEMRPVWVLYDLFVAPSGRRSGAGRALLRDVLERARVAGVAGVQLETAYDNDTAQALYEAEGFVREKFHVYFHGLR
ncbi:GNAT family N-acetyltransferase [Streptomyces sp. NPDC086023]|uniref:GNAT family N-acetyltransferase n=1 Tax=Streptomyces sp. NPDC086023 TaxID=3365746 RepID=UPI0037D38046